MSPLCLLHPYWEKPAYVTAAVKGQVSSSCLESVEDSEPNITKVVVRGEEWGGREGGGKREERS